MLRPLVLTTFALTLQPVFAADAELAEVHIQLCDDLERSQEVLDLRDDDSEKKELWFFDTRDLALYDSGIILRAIQHDGQDEFKFDMKLRPLSPASVDDEWNDEDGFSCEADVYADRTIDGCKLRREDSSDKLDDVVSGRTSPTRLVSRKQQALLDETTGRDVEHTRLYRFGPAKIRVWDLGEIADVPDVQVEIWRVTRDMVITEVSARVDRTQAEQASERLRNELERDGLQLCDDDEAKTRQVLAAFQATAR